MSAERASFSRCIALASNCSRDTINAKSSGGTVGDSATVTLKYLCSIWFLMSLRPRDCGSATSSFAFSKKSLASQYKAQNPQLPVKSNSFLIIGFFSSVRQSDRNETFFSGIFKPM